MSTLQYPKISDKVYEILFGEIVNRKLKPGHRLVESCLAEELGVSRTPLRDAIARLAKEGFVEINPRKGACIKEFNIEDVIEVYDIRKSLERLAISLAVLKIEDNDLKRLKDLFSKGNKKALARADAELHHLIINSSGNKKLINMLDNLYNFIEVFRVTGYYFKDRAEKAASGHIKILNALIKRDKTLAEKLIEEHIETTKQDILYNFKQSQKE